MLECLIRHKVSLARAAPSYHWKMSQRKDKGQAPPVFEIGRSYAPYPTCRQRFEVVDKGASALVVRIDGQEQEVPLFRWRDGGESVILQDEHGHDRDVTPEYRLG